MTDAEKRLTDAAGEADDLRARESEADRLGDRDGDPQRGGRLPSAKGDDSDEAGPRPADERARAGIPSRSFDL